MPYDPKKMYEPRVVEPSKDAPRGTMISGRPAMADRIGNCVQCGEPYTWGDDVYTKGEMDTARDYWHPACWKATHTDGY